MSSSMCLLKLCIVLCLTTGVVFTAPLNSLTESQSIETMENMLMFFNRPPPTFKIFTGGLLLNGGVSSCLQSCMQPGKSASEIHACSRQCLTNSEPGVTPVVG